MQRLFAGISLLVVLILAGLLFATYLDASDGFAVNRTTTQSVTAHGVCAKITNNSSVGTSVYIPTNSVAEWQSFRDHPPAGVTLASCVTPGSQTFSTPGTYVFAVPTYNTLTVEVWGAGGGGQGRSTDTVSGTGGGQSRFGTTLIANGGTNNRTGGSASGGTTNLTGGTGNAGAFNGSGGTLGKGGDGANGGAGGAAVGSNGNEHGHDGSAPGGGGGGASFRQSRIGVHFGAGGGGGGYAASTYSMGDFAPGTTVSVTVGAGGVGGNSSYDGGDGAPGRVTIIWQ